MANKKYAGDGRWLRNLILGIGLTPLALVGVGVMFGVVPFRIFQAYGTPQPSAPPEALALPWISGAVGWTFVFVCVGLTVLILWLDRGRKQRVEPLALLALCLAALGHAEAIHAARVMAFSDAWPVNLVDVGIWILLAASGVGVLAWLRMLISKNPARGRVFATCAILCSLGSAWIMHTFLGEPWKRPTAEDGIELAVAHYSSPERSYNIEITPTVLIHADGTSSPDSIVEFARDMQQEDGVPDEMTTIRADHRASWSAVRQVLTEVADAGIWKLRFVTRWEDPQAETVIVGYLPRAMGIETHEPAAPTHIVRVGAQGALHFDDGPCADRAALSEELGKLDARRRGGVIQIQPNDAATWEDVIDTLGTVNYATDFEEVQLGPFALFLN